MVDIKKIFVAVVIYLGLAVPALAADTNAVTIVNPLRGGDFWEHNFEILDTPRQQYKAISDSTLPATWLLRYDALENPEVTAFVKSMNSDQEIGLFLEITPSLTLDAKVSYNQSSSWHKAKSVLLIGYSVEDRKKLIDQSFEVFNREFGYYPKSVGAWWIDAGSLAYMKDKYGIEANLSVADQFSTDGYQVWGQYWSIPFYPSKFNALMPAQSPDNKIGVLTTQWAARDPFNGYGQGVEDSTYSVQVNDYMLHDLGITYFEKFLKLYPQITVGLENDFSFAKYGGEHQKQIALLAQKQKSQEITLYTMTGYAKWYRDKYPELSPSVLISSNNFLDDRYRVVWFQNIKYRIGWFYGPSGSVIRDLRIYNDTTKEPCLEKACEQLNLADSFISAIDEVSLDISHVVDEGKISAIKVDQKGSYEVEINYNNQAGVSRKIRFLENDVEINGQIKTLPVLILNTVSSSQSREQHDKSQMGEIFNPGFDYQRKLPVLLINFCRFVIFSFFFFFLPGWALSKRLLVALPLGWVIFTLTSYVSGYIGLPGLMWILPVVGIIASVTSGIPKVHIRVNKEMFTAPILIILGSAIWLTTVFRSGLVFDYGMGFWGPNGHDGIWHLSLISQLKQNLPAQNPILAGTELKNYHYFYDLLIAKSSQLGNFDTSDLLFRFFPIFIALLSGLLIYKVAGEMFRSRKAGNLAVFFLYFGSGMGWVLNFMRERSFGGESLFWAQQSVSTLLNPPYAVSVIIFLAGLSSFISMINQQKFTRLTLLLPAAILWGTLIEFKAYGGLVVLGGLGLLTLEGIVFKKDTRLIPLLLLSSLLAMLVFLPNNINGASLIVFAPFWFINSMVIFQDRLNWERLAMAMQSPSIFKVVISYALGVFLFILGNFWTRLVGLFAVNKSPEVKLLVYVSIISLTIPLFFVQKGTNWNSIQFLYYSIFVFNILAAGALASILKKLSTIFSAVVLLFITALNLPGTYGTFIQYIPDRPPTTVTSNELEALEYLKNQPAGTVMTMLPDSRLKSKFVEPVLPLYSTPNISKLIVSSIKLGLPDKAET